MRTRILAFALLVLGLCGNWLPTARAAADYFLKLDDIRGEATADSHKDWIEIQSFQWGVTRPPGTNPAANSGSIFTKKADKATPLLMLACAKKDNLDRAAVEFVHDQQDGSPVRYYRYELENVLITSYGSRAGEDPGTDVAETLRLDATKIKLSYVQFDADNRPVEELAVYWDFLRDEGGVVGPAFKVVIEPDGNQLRLTWPTQQGRTYHIRGSSSVNGVYSIEQTVTAAETGSLSTTVPVNLPHRFFLVEEAP